MHLTFQTCGFRDSPAQIAKACNFIEGYTLCAALQDGMRDAGFTVDAIFDEDHGSCFETTRDGAAYWVIASLAFDEDAPLVEMPMKDEESGDDIEFYVAADASVAEAHVFVEKKRSLTDWLLGRNKLTKDDPACSAVLA